MITATTRHHYKISTIHTSYLLVHTESERCTICDTRRLVLHRGGFFFQYLVQTPTDSTRCDTWNLVLPGMYVSYQIQSADWSVLLYSRITLLLVSTSLQHDYKRLNGTHRPSVSVSAFYVLASMLGYATYWMARTSTLSATQPYRHIYYCFDTTVAFLPGSVQNRLYMDR